MSSLRASLKTIPAIVCRFPRQGGTAAFIPLPPHPYIWKPCRLGPVLLGLLAAVPNFLSTVIGGVTITVTDNGSHTMGGSAVRVPLLGWALHPRTCLSRFLLVIALPLFLLPPRLLEAHDQGTMSTSPAKHKPQRHTAHPATARGRSKATEHVILLLCYSSDLVLHFLPGTCTLRLYRL